MSSPILSKYAGASQKMGYSLSSRVPITLPESLSSGTENSTPAWEAHLLNFRRFYVVFVFLLLALFWLLIGALAIETISHLRSLAFYGAFEPLP